jgi:hypothetical protein
MTLYEKMLNEGAFPAMRSIEWMLLQAMCDDILTMEEVPAVDVEMGYELWPEIAHAYQSEPEKIEKFRKIFNVPNDEDWKRK